MATTKPKSVKPKKKPASQQLKEDMERKWNETACAKPLKSARWEVVSTHGDYFIRIREF